MKKRAITTLLLAICLFVACLFTGCTQEGEWISVNSYPPIRNFPPQKYYDPIVVRVGDTVNINDYIDWPGIDIKKRSHDVSGYGKKSKFKTVEVGTILGSVDIYGVYSGEKIVENYDYCVYVLPQDEDFEVITTQEQLRTMKPKGYYRLGIDIRLEAGFTSELQATAGLFEGAFINPDGYTISGFRPGENSDPNEFQYCLFGERNRGYIDGLRLEVEKGSVPLAEAYPICGDNYGVIRNSIVTGSLFANVASGMIGATAKSAFYASRLQNCYTDVDITANTTAGGFFNLNNVRIWPTKSMGTIENLAAYGDITMTDAYDFPEVSMSSRVNGCVGGIGGSNDEVLGDIRIQNLLHCGEIRMEGSEEYIKSLVKVGGIFGYGNMLYDMKFDNCLTSYERVYGTIENKPENFDDSLYAGVPQSFFYTGVPLIGFDAFTFEKGKLPIPTSTIKK